MFAIPVIQLIKDQAHHLQLRLLAGEAGLAKKITIPRIQKPGLALAGDLANLHPGRLLVFGNPEIKHLQALTAARRRAVIAAFTGIDIAGIVVTEGNRVAPPLRQACERAHIALFLTPLLTSTFINRVTRFFDERLTATTCLHGVLMDVYGIGILIIGKSGIGKSECALDLILRGHRLVADDIVNVTKRPPNTLYGTGSEIIKHHMEIRGLGIINVCDLFGVAAIRDRKLIEVVCELAEWDSKAEYDRLGIEEKTHVLLDVPLPLIQIPVRPGRNITTIIEVAARNQLLKLRGHHSGRQFQERLQHALQMDREERATQEATLE